MVSTITITLPQKKWAKTALLTSAIMTLSLSAPLVSASEVPNITHPSVTDKIDGPLIKAAASHASLLRLVEHSESARLATPLELNTTMDELSSLVTQNFSEGLTAYGALVGAQTSPFIDGLYARVKAEGLDSVAYSLYADPNYVTQISGAPVAAANINSAWAQNNSLLERAGAAIKQRSYDLQKDPSWRKQRADDRDARISEFKHASQTLRSLNQSETYQIASAAPISSLDATGPQRRQSFSLVYGQQSAQHSMPSPNDGEYSPALKKALTLAALEAIGATGRDSHDWMKTYMAEPVMNQCLSWARLNTEQCLAAGHFKYEDAFCVAEHQLTEASECMDKSGF